MLARWSTSHPNGVCVSKQMAQFTEDRSERLIYFINWIIYSCRSSRGSTEHGFAYSEEDQVTVISFKRCCLFKGMAAFSLLF